MKILWSFLLFLPSFLILSAEGEDRCNNLLLSQIDMKSSSRGMNGKPFSSEIRRMAGDIPRGDKNKLREMLETEVQRFGFSALKSRDLEFMYPEDDFVAILLLRVARLEDDSLLEKQYAIAILKLFKRDAEQNFIHSFIEHDHEVDRLGAINMQFAKSMEEEGNPEVLAEMKDAIKDIEKMENTAWKTRERIKNAWNSLLRDSFHTVIPYRSNHTSNRNIH